MRHRVRVRLVQRRLRLDGSLRQVYQTRPSSYIKICDSLVLSHRFFTSLCRQQGMADIRGSLCSQHTSIDF